MIKFIINNDVSFYTKNPALHKKVSEMFTVTNPAFSKKLAMGYSVWGIDQYEKYYKRKGDKVSIPIGGFPALLNQEELDSEEVEIEDNRVCVSDKEFFNNLSFNAKLRGYQSDLVDKVMDTTIGVVKAKTGSGKTICFINIICKRKVNTLILVHLKELLDQTINSIVSFTNLDKKDIGVISGGKAKLKPITVALVQSMVSIKKGKPDIYSQIKNYFGQVIGDETHIIAAKTYYNVASDLPFKYKYGFSATPIREDGLTDLIHFVNGPIIHEVPDEAVKSKLIIPEYKTYDSDFYFPYFDSTEYQTMITYLGENKKRNDFIKGVYNAEVDGPCCFLCSRINQVEALKERFPDAVVITSKKKKKDREEGMKKLLSGERDKVITTYPIFSTGLDWPALRFAILCSPIGSYVQIKQLGGRLMRQAEGKKDALIIDILDPKIGVFYKKARKRAKILRNL